MIDPGEWTKFGLAVAAAILAALLITLVVTIPFRLIARRVGWNSRLIGSFRRPLRALVLSAALWIAVALYWPDSATVARTVLTHILQVAVIASAGWLLAGIVSFIFARTLARYPTDAADNRESRRIQTQVIILRRLSTLVIGLVTVGAILLTFDGVQAIGASLLASAGLVGIVAGLAAQSALANVIAGLQLAFSDAIRVDDVVVVDGEFGRIEEITLTYIVVRIWDDRRLVMPSTYFTTKPFENWTRSSSALIGTVEFDVDWRVSPAKMREQLAVILESEPLWDGRSSVLQVTDATGGLVRVRVLVTAADAGALWDLRCNVREELVEWVHAKSPAALPRQRVQMVEAERRPSTRKQVGHAGLFTGSPEAEERGHVFRAGAAESPRGPVR